MRDNEYTAELLRTFRARFMQLNRSDAFPKEDVTEMLVKRVALSEVAVSLEGFKNIVLDLLGILVALPGARMFNLRPHLVRYISELLEDVRSPALALPLLLRVMTEPDEFNEFDIWKSASQLVDQNRDKEMVFPFLRLPREIRKEIYIYAFQSEHPKWENRSTLPPNKISAYHPNNPKNRLSLLRVNRQTHEEGRKDLFNNFVVQIGDAGTLHRLLNSLPPTAKSLIRSLEICGIRVKQTGALAHRLSDRSLCNVRNLRIDCCPTFDGPLYFRGHGLPMYDKWPKYDSKLQEAVHGLFERNTTMKFTPSLELCAFEDLPNESITFPDKWNVSITREAGPSFLASQSNYS
ncbi:hypothetical protein FQN54_008510 [Arachnomyces sp. PD_36]|nr:hypothetical protein FQN54_008510 [Arachnomyces sp. PD_36]